MAGHLRKSERKRYTIDELAMTYWTARHRNDWRRARTQMRSCFGRKATDEALEHIARGLELCDPNFKRPHYR